MVPSDDVDDRLLLAVLQRLGDMPKSLYRSYLEPGETLRDYKRKEKGGYHAAEALTVAEFFEEIGAAANQSDLSLVAASIRSQAQEMLRKDDKNERQRWDDLAEEDVKLRDELRIAGDEQARIEDHRWATAEWCSVSDFCFHVTPPRSVPEVQNWLRSRGYLDGDVGAYYLTTKALLDGVAKVEIKGPKQGLVQWRKELFEHLRQELEPPSP